MKKIIACITAAALIICGGLILRTQMSKNTADGSCNIKAAVLGSGKDAFDALNQLQNGIIANINAASVSAQDDLSSFDILYITESLSDINTSAIEDYVYNGGTVVIDNDAVKSFSNELIGAADIVPLNGCPVDLQYNEVGENLSNISELLYDYTELFKNYENFERYTGYDYGIGIIPSTAETIAEYNGTAIYTLNKYGNGNVFITNPILPGKYTISSFDSSETGEPFAFSTIGAETLLRSYYAEYVSKEKYGFAVERSFGSFASNTAAWELHYEDITGIENGSMEEFSKLCMEHGQMPSYTLTRNLYTWFKRSESLTYLKYDGDIFKSDSYEGVYCSGTHVVSSGKWLKLESYNETDSYFIDNEEYTKRLYPCITDWNKDGKPDFICGSSDGKFYYFEGNGMSDNYETGISTLLTDDTGNPLSVGAYSSPVLFDIDGDGNDDLISGGEDGVIRIFKSLKTDENSRSCAFYYYGNAIETNLTDSMIDAGDLNGDGITDLAVGSRNGEMRIYYGFTNDGFSTIFSDYVTVETNQNRIAPCIHNGELFGGTLDGYIAHYRFNGENYEFDRFLEYDDISNRGNNYITIGMNCVPRFCDIDGDGDDDLICGSLEYGMAYPIDSKYFPCYDKLSEQIDFCKKNNMYLGIHNYTHKYASPEHEKRELEYHKSAFDYYNLPWNGKGANQHTWFTSMYGTDGSGESGSNQSYDGTFSAQNDSGLLWNSGFTPPQSGQIPQNCAENAIPMPVYMKNRDFLLMQVSNTPHGNGAYSYISAKYDMPMLFYNHCDYIYNNSDENEQIKAVNKAGSFAKNYDYMFVGEDQMAKAVAAAYNSDIKTELRDGNIIISRHTRDTAGKLYDENYGSCTGVKVVFADSVDVEYCITDASVHRVKDNSMYVSLDKAVTIKGTGQSNENIEIKEINIPAEVHKNKKYTTVTFKDSGLMCVRVKGSAHTNCDGWLVSQEDGDTIFTKFGSADELKIEN